MSTDRSWTARFLTFAIFTLCLGTFSEVTFAKKATVRVISPQDSVQKTGRAYGEWGDAFWNWVFTIGEDNPLLAEGLIDCSVGQDGRVWFLAGNFGGTNSRECTVPPGKLLFFPIITTVWWSPDDGPDAEALRAIANGFIDSTETLTVTIDGTVLPDPFAFRGQSPQGGFALDMPEDGLWLFFDLESGGVASGIHDPSVSDGYYLMVRLSKGTHEIHFAASTEGSSFELDLTYYLTVEGNRED